jgi:hypothetical protein
MDSVYRTSLRLSDWTFVFGLPTQKSEFEWSRAVGEFCHNFDSWGSYDEYLLSRLTKLILPLRSCGLRVVLCANSRKLRGALQRDRAVVLYTHCNSTSRRLEFREGMIDFETVARGISRDFSGIADISACEAAGLECVIKAKAPRCAVKVVPCKLDALGWLRFYATFFLQFSEREMSYAEAIVLTSAAEAARSPKVRRSDLSNLVQKRKD